MYLRYSVDPRGGRWAGTKTPPFGGVRSIYLDTENIQDQTPARICMHRKVSFFRSMKLTRNRSFILLKIQRQFLRVFACNQQKFLLTQNHVHDAVPAQRHSDRETGRLRYSRNCGQQRDLLIPCMPYYLSGSAGA